MKAVRALILLVGVSKSVFRVKEFRRAPEHGNKLIYGGKPLDVEEFNKVSSKIVSEVGKTTYGIMPSVELVEVDLPDPEPQASTPASQETGKAAEANSAPVFTLPADVEVEAIEGGFVIADYRAPENTVFLGKGDGGWASDISITEPFETEDEAKATFLGVPVPVIEANSESALPLTTSAPSLTEDTEPQELMPTGDLDDDDPETPESPTETATGDTSAHGTEPEFRESDPVQAPAAPAKKVAKKVAKKKAKTAPAE